METKATAAYRAAEGIAAAPRRGRTIFCSNRCRVEVNLVQRAYAWRFFFCPLPFLPMHGREFLRRTAAIGAARLTAFPHHLFATTASKQANDRIKLGKTGIATSRLAMGTGTNGWSGASDQTRGLGGVDGTNKLLKTAFDHGVTFWDSADVYGSHPNLRAALRSGIPREEVTILTQDRSADARRTGPLPSGDRHGLPGHRPAAQAGHRGSATRVADVLPRVPHVCSRGRELWTQARHRPGASSPAWRRGRRRDERFHLARKQSLRNDTRWQGVVVDVGECAVERPKKSSAPATRARSAATP